MNGWEAWANATLRSLNQAQSTRQLAPAEYCRRRRELLDSIARLTSDPSTLRRHALHAGQAAMMPVCDRPASPKGAGPMFQALRSWRFRVWLLCMLAGAAFLYWQYAGRVLSAQ